jgi:hypothetical protein
MVIAITGRRKQERTSANASGELVGAGRLEPLGFAVSERGSAAG